MLVAHFLVACCDSVVYYYSKSPRVWCFCAHVPVGWGAKVTTLHGICSLYHIRKKEKIRGGMGATQMFLFQRCKV